MVDEVNRIYHTSPHTSFKGIDVIGFERSVRYEKTLSWKVS